MVALHFRYVQSGQRMNLNVLAHTHCKVYVHILPCDNILGEEGSPPPEILGGGRKVSPPPPPPPPPLSPRNLSFTVHQK